MRIAFFGSFLLIITENWLIFAGLTGIKPSFLQEPDVSLVVIHKDAEPGGAFFSVFHIRTIGRLPWAVSKRAII